jgi:hypothetical protein
VLTHGGGAVRSLAVLPNGRLGQRRRAGAQRQSGNLAGQRTRALYAPKRSKPGAARPNFDRAALLMTNDEGPYRSRACTIVRPMR